MAKTIFIEKSYIAASIINIKSEILRKEFTTVEELNYVSNKLQKELNDQNFNAIILDEVDNDYFDVSDVIKINTSKGLSLESINSRYQGYLDLDILLLIWNKKTILNYLCEFKINNEDKQVFDIMVIPCPKAFVVTPEKTEEFKNRINSKNDNDFIRKIVEKIRVNNLVEEGPVLKKIENLIKNKSRST